MRKSLAAGILVTALLAGLPASQAEAACRDNNACTHKLAVPKKAASAKQVRHKAHAVKHSRKKTAAHKPRSGKARPAASGGQVVALIKSMAPGYGVPSWFALRIAQVESNYNPNARGSAGELGVYQLKCSTARGLGYRGACSGLLNAHTNVQYGLKHLALAMKSSGGNLRLAASKHNGGLGRRTEVRGYVAKVF